MPRLLLFLVSVVCCQPVGTAPCASCQRACTAQPLLPQQDSAPPEHAAAAAATAGWTCLAPTSRRPSPPAPTRRALTVRATPALPGRPACVPSMRRLHPLCACCRLPWACRARQAASRMLCPRHTPLLPLPPPPLPPTCSNKQPCVPSSPRLSTAHNLFAGTLYGLQPGVGRGAPEIDMVEMK